MTLKLHPIDSLGSPRIGFSWGVKFFQILFNWNWKTPSPSSALVTFQFHYYENLLILSESGIQIDNESAYNIFSPNVSDDEIDDGQPKSAESSQKVHEIVETNDFSNSSLFGRFFVSQMKFRCFHKSFRMIPPFQRCKILI